MEDQKKYPMGHITIQMPDDMIAGLERAAATLDMNRSKLVRTFVEEGLNSFSELLEARRRDHEAREYLANFLVKKGIARPYQVATDDFFYGATPALWLQKVEKRLGAEAANELSEKIVEIMGRTAELAAYLADDSE